MRNLPTVTKNLLIVNLLAFLAMLVLKTQGIDLNNLLGLHFFKASDFHIYQFFTYMFMHANWTHIFFNMFALWMFGCVVENTWGSRRFLFYYICCGVGAGFAQEVAQYVQYSLEHLSEYDSVATQLGNIPMADYLNLWYTVGASGAVYGILLAFGLTFPEERIFIFPLPVPIKAKWLVCIYAAIEIFSIVNQTNDQVAHLAHLGGMLFGFLIIRYWERHPESYYGGRLKGEEFFESLKRNWETRKGKRAPEEPASASSVKRETDWQYNERKQKNQEEIDRILDKIRKSGYDSLTKEEKKYLFDQSNS